MDYHPNSRVDAGEDVANDATSSSPSANLPDNDLISNSWFLYDDLDIDAISDADLHSKDSTLASSPPSVFPPFTNKKNEKARSGLHPTNPFSSTYKPTAAPAPTLPPSPMNAHCMQLSSVRALTPTPSPRSARSSEFRNARIASYEARTVEAAVRATARATTKLQSPFFDKNTRSSSAPSLPKPIHNAIIQKFPAPPSDPIKPDNLQEPHTTCNETLSTSSRIIEAGTSSREKGKGRRSSSISSQLSPFAEFYVAATERFPESLNDAALESDESEQVHGSPGPSKKRQVVLNGRKEYVIEDGEGEWEKEEREETPSPDLPLVSRFQIRGDDHMIAITLSPSNSGRGNSKSLSWEDGRAKARFSCTSSGPSSLDLYDAKRDEEARSYCEDELAELEGVVDKVVLADHENDPSYSRVNSQFSRSTIPARDEHSEPLNLSERKPDRDKVFQLYLSGFPKYEVNDVFFDRTERLNEEAKRRATCIDDPNANLTRPTCPGRKNTKLPLHERLSNLLPSPSNFTPSLMPDGFTFGTWDYRPRDWSLRTIEMASIAPDLELGDDSLRARAAQYSANKKTIKMALGEDKILEADVLKRQLCHSVKASGNMSDGPQSAANVETLQSLILAQHELRQDIERLEARKRGVQASFSTLHMLPTRRRLGNALQRQSLADNVEQVRMKRITGMAEELTEVLIDESCSLDHDLYRALASLDPVAEYLSDTPNMSIATNLATGESFPFGDRARSRRPATPRPSSVYSDRSVRLKSGTTMPHAVLKEAESTDGGDVPNLPQPVAHDRAAAYRIMQSVQTYHNIRRTSGRSAGNGSVYSESARTGRAQERGL